MSTQTVTGLGYRDKSVVDPSVPAVGSSRVRKVCGVCLDRPVHAQGRCLRCYQYRRRHGHDHSMARLHAATKRKPTIIPRRQDLDEDTLSFAEWSRLRGYNPRTRKYAR